MTDRFLGALPLPLSQLIAFVIIVGVLGVIIFFVGEALPRGSFNYRAFPYRSFAWERNGAVYERVRIHVWKDKAPDMSKMVRRTFAKKILSPRDPEYTRHLVLETCSAEFVHEILILVSPVFPALMAPGYGAWAMVLYIVGNLPFIAIQRYNRPRLIRLMERQTETLSRKKMQKASK